jgi:uncharacterized pyridoxamine 5'-phosphate oxidase family protein
MVAQVVRSDRRVRKKKRNQDIKQNQEETEMNRGEIFNFVEKNPLFYLGTVENGKPFVRGMMAAMVREDGIIFCTGKEKDVYRQMKENAEVEMCFYSQPEEKQLRLSGRIEELDDLELKKQIVEKFEFLKPWVEQEGYEVMAVFRLGGGKAVVWTMETHAEPKVYIDF